MGNSRYWQYASGRMEFAHIVIKGDDEYEPYQEVGNKVTVRVNLIDYVLTFWDTKTDKILQLRQIFEEEESDDESEDNEEDEYEEEEEQETENGMPVLYEPIVIAIPKDVNIKWYPA